MSSGSTKPLLVLFTGTTVPVVKDRFGDFDAHFKHAIGDAWSGPWATVDAREDAVKLPDFSSISGVIVTGSSSSVTLRAETPWMLRLEPWLRDAVCAELPLLGVCFGHQILASALGGEVRKNPKGRHIGSLSVRKVEDDPLFEGVPHTFEVNVSHQDHVALPPPNVRMLVTADHDPMHAFAAGNKARAVQFHPEFHEEIIRGYIGARREILKNEGLDADALLSRVIDPPYAKTILRNFVTNFVSRESARFKK
ncbi:MAG: glutamine amidotransferase [Polyangiales bacterium]